MKNRIIQRLSNNLGNQMFMYAFGYALSKELNRELYIDNETAYKSRNNFHKYNLNIFKFSAKLAPNSLKYLGFTGYMRRKTYKVIDRFKVKKKFYIEKKDKNKITSFNNDFINQDFEDNLFVEGHFESEKYFSKYRSDILNEFSFNNYETLQMNNLYNKLNNSNSVSICLRRHRFSERKRQINKHDIQDSNKFTIEQAAYVMKAIKIIKNKISNPKFFLWSNDYEDIHKYLPDVEFTIVSTNNIDLDLFLMTQSKNFIVIPSSYNWWGCWLSKNSKKIVYRPSDNFFSKFKVNNSDFWPSNWNVID